MLFLNWTIVQLRTMKGKNWKMNNYGKCFASQTWGTAFENYIYTAIKTTLHEAEQ